MLDIAWGRGRNALVLARRGQRVLAVDRDSAALASMPADPGIDTLQADLEGRDWPLGGRRFGGVIVTNYLYRPRFAAVLDLLEPSGLLIYETFAAGNERFGKPSNPDFLLRPGELLERVHGRLRVVAYEEGVVAQPRPAVVQRICARAETAITTALAC